MILFNWLQFWRAVIKRFNEDGCFYRAAALAYTTLLSLVPFLTVVFTVLKSFAIFNVVSQQIQEFIFNNFVPTSGQIVQNYLQQFIEQSTHLSSIGSLFLVVTAVLLLFTIEESFNKIWQVPKARKLFRAIFLYGGTLILAPLLIGFSLISSAYLLSLPVISYTAEWLKLTKFLLIFAPFLLNTLALTLLYIVVPNCKVPLRCGISGALITAVLFELAKQGFSLYVMWFPTYQLIYGALAVIPIFLVWIYLSWLVVLFGAEVSHALVTKK
jgi:membrane protein